MSKQTLEKMVRQELESLNDIIDEKIIRGQSYKAEARRHKFLLSKLYRVKVKSGMGSNWFARSFSFF